MGWVIETVYLSIYHGHFVKRGFLIEPICVIYGIGTILVICILTRIKAHPILLFLSSSLIATFLELIVGALFNTLLNQRLWDYSAKFANFMGYICLSSTLVWGILSLFVVYIIHPIIIKFIDSIPIKIKETICYCSIVFLSLDISISIYTSLKGINNIMWLSQIFSERLKVIEYVTSKVVYYISH